MMQEFSHLLRQAYIQSLADLKLNNIPIPVNDEVLTSPAAVINKAQCYVILTNQTVNDAPGTKCGDAYLASIQVDIVTKFPINSGAKLTSELISVEVLKLLKENPPALEELNIWKWGLETNRGLREDSDTYRIFRKILVFSHNINE